MQPSFSILNFCVVLIRMQYIWSDPVTAVAAFDSYYIGVDGLYAWNNLHSKVFNVNCIIHTVQA